jgi:hypothetical protein
VTLFLTWYAKTNLVTQIKEVVPSLPKDHYVRAFRQVELNPLLFEFHQPTRVHFGSRTYWLRVISRHLPQAACVV